MPTDRIRSRATRQADLAGPAVVAYSTESDGHPQVRRAAQAHAQEHGCVLILYVADVASAFSEPLPNQWDAEGEPDQFGDRLMPRISTRSVDRPSPDKSGKPQTPDSGPVPGCPRTTAPGRWRNTPRRSELTPSSFPKSSTTSTG